MPEPVAVIAANARGAREAARRLSAESRLRAPLTPCTPASYLLRRAAPSRVVLCAPSGSPDAASEFLRRWAERLLWPAPPVDLHRAIDGIRPAIAAPRRIEPRHPAPSRRRRHTSARLLEGRVDARRAAAALAAGDPLDWIVESPRHVRLSRRELEHLSARGVRWSALEPVELLGVYGPPSLAASRRAWAGALPRGVPFWSREADGARR